MVEVYLVYKQKQALHISPHLAPLSQAPCRQLLTTIIEGLNAHLFTSHHDIYMPNCDKRGFFRKKQVSFRFRCFIRNDQVQTDCKDRTYLYFTLLTFVVFVQCWSSRGGRRGKCWCVDKSGMPLSTSTKHKGGVSC